MGLIFIIISISIIWVASLWKIFFSHSKPTFLNEGNSIFFSDFFYLLILFQLIFKTRYTFAQKNVLLVVAHPDDESMFFSPTINYLTSKGHNLYLPLVLGLDKVVPEAQKFRTSGIDPEFEEKLEQMFMGIVATGDKAWAPSSGTLRSDFFEDVNNKIPEENEEENIRNGVHILNDVHISNDVQIDGNGQKRKNPEISSSHFKTERKKSLKQIGGAARLSSQMEKLCNAADNMSQAISSLTPVMDPYGIPQAVKVLDSMSEEVPEASPLYFFALKLLLNKDK
ncbi:uncharacterized protein [Gossypium hirsutum]|uniref:Uncharacterized protein isoform X1 n=2 Tax=Gossypium hirsutum TaxID=3635 RepID=A0ABM3ACC2_GOSHI|nr:uncharacterized protein LOC121203591 isoform X1 [Gossypium hirsutum]